MTSEIARQVAVPLVEFMRQYIIQLEAEIKKEET